MVKARFRRTEDLDDRTRFASIRDTAACKVWLASLVPLDSIENLDRVGEFIGELIQGPLAPARKFEIIDRVRAALYPGLRERVRDNTPRGVPLTTAETEPIWAMVDAVEDVREAYEVLLPRLSDAVGTTSMVLEEPDEELTQTEPTKVMALHRALDLNAHVIALYLRLRVAVPDRLWSQHCRMGQLSRQLNCQDDELDDPLAATMTESCREAFTMPLLLALADSTMLSQQEFLAALSCASRWASKTGFRIDSSSELGGPPVRPALNPGPVVQLAGNEHQVRLDTQRVQKSIDRRLALLDEGNSPQSIGLGEGISGAASRALLRGLTRRWGAIMPESIDFPEFNWRAPHSEFALAVVGMGQSSDAAQRTSVSSATGEGAYDYVRKRDEALTRSHAEVERARIERVLDGAETWSLIGETPDSALCMRRAIRPRLSLGQLVGLKLGGKAGPTPFLLGSVQGLQQGINDNSEGVARPALTHLIRVRFLPGLPQLVKASVDQVEVDWVYLLSPNAPARDDISIWEQVRANQQSYALVLPLATFRPARTMRVVAQGLASALRLEELVQRGLDFDLARFKLV
jgi:hypothetical protein